MSDISAPDSASGSPDSAFPGAPSPLPSPASPTHRPAQTEASPASTAAAGPTTPATTDDRTGPPTGGLATNATTDESASGSPSTPADATASGTTSEPTSGPPGTRYDGLVTNTATNEPPVSDSPDTPADGLAANARSNEPAADDPGTSTHPPAHGLTSPLAHNPSGSDPSTPVHARPTAAPTNDATGHTPAAPPTPPSVPVPIDTHLERVRSRLTRLNPEQAQDAARRGALLVDIRYAALRDRDGLIPGALVVERNELEWRLDPQGSHRLPEADRHDREIVVLCNEGYASSLAAASLHDLGLFRATDLVGGFQAWRAAGLPVTAPATP